jgi:hypothetical protein
MVRGRLRLDAALGRAYAPLDVNIRRRFPSASAPVEVRTADARAAA